MQRIAIYEFPLNERIRNFMRLENSFAQIVHFASRNNVWDNQASLLVLLDALNIMERHDIKGEIAKELERNITLFNNLLDLPNVNHDKLQRTLDDLNTELNAIQNIPGRIAKILREDDLLGTLKQRMAVNAGVNNFEIPSYYFWLNQSDEHRQKQIDTWLNDSVPIANAISIILDLLRNSVNFEEHVATAGFFQHALPAPQNCQMLRIAVPATVNCFPETSGNKHRVSIRFLTYADTKQRPVQVADDIAFTMSCCGF